MRSLSILAAFAATSLLALAPQTSASNDTNVPAEDCVRVSGPDIYLNGGRVENNDTSQVLSIDCPILNHNVGSVTLAASVAYRDLNPAGVVRCSLTVVRFDGASAISQNYALQSEASFVSSEFKNLLLLRPGVGRPDLYFINCKIPPKTSNGRSGIAFIQVYED